MTAEGTPSRERNDFIRDIIDADLASGKHKAIATRFPPEPNGYLHIGHAKSICLNFGLAKQYGGTCNLRFDDTNPTKEDIEYAHAIERDVRWLGFEPSKVLFSADYFEQMYELAVALIRAGKAYVCDLNEEDIRVYRGSLTEPGKPSPWRDRNVAENLDLFSRMRAGEFKDSARVLRAKIDLAAANMKMRDPLLYRIRHEHHYRTGDAWCIYPMYDYAHPLEDAIEGITHSICTLEFENNRELYDWVIEHTGVPCKPRQYEFARLNIDYTVMSKRKLLQLVKTGVVSGWDDPRMPTIAGMRRRGYSAAALRAFCDMIGVAKNNSVVDIGKLEFCVRDDLNQNAPRVLAVLSPLPVELTTVAADASEWFDAPSFPEDIGKPGSRNVGFTREVLIERDDFMETPEADFKRLAPGRTVRLRYGYAITCTDVVKDASGNVVGLRCEHHPESLHGKPVADGRKVSGVIHWVSAKHSVPAEVRLYDRLFSAKSPDEGDGDFLKHLNPASLATTTGARVESSLAGATEGRFQFERLGFFCIDVPNKLTSGDTSALPGSKPDALIFNRIVSLRDTWQADAATDKTAAAPSAAKSENVKNKTRPKSKSPAEFRAEARERSPELKAAFERMQSEYGLTAADADVLSGELPLAQLFVDAASKTNHHGSVASWLVNQLTRERGERELSEIKLTPTALASLVDLVEAGKLNNQAAKDVFAVLVNEGGNPADIVKARGLDVAVTNEQIAAWLKEALAENADKAAALLGGKTALLGFFIGQVVKKSGGRADPATLNQLLAGPLASLLA
ncbi:MAG: glutamine--tRNA ligase/YqeY domain fusion protein [Myxococcales bacterium]|nr:glutamine--tRNA ligase/YqeY domain fusion protein [Myxococcales bacterium]